MDGLAKPALVERFQPLAFPGRGDAHEIERLKVDGGGQCDQTHPAARLGPAESAPKTIGRPAGTQEPPRHAGHLQRVA